MTARHLLLLLLACAGALPAAEPTAEEAARIAAACPAAAPARPKAPRRVLVFNRNEGFDHTAIGVGGLAVESLGRKTGAFTVVHSTDLAIFSADRLKGFDAVVFNNGYGFKLADPKARAALLDFVRGGKGVVGIHAASANFEGWPEGSALIGASFHSHPWTPIAEWPVRNEQPDHPLNASFGGQGFRLKDELYTFTGFQRSRARVLLSIDLSDKATGDVKHPHPYVPISWLYPLGQGRVFFCSLGHQHDVFWNKAYLGHLLAGLQYALGDLAAADQPDPAATVRLTSSANDAERRDAFEFLDTQTGTPAQRSVIERAILAQLATSPEPERINDLADPLSKVASNACLPTLAAWLTDGQRSHAARRVLQRLGTPEARSALRTALAKATGTVKAGLIGSLVDLGDAEAAPLLAAALVDAEPRVVQAALAGLGRLGGSVAAQALLDARPAASMAAVHEDALAACAERSPANERAVLYLALTDPARPARARVLGLAGLVGLRSEQAGRLTGEFLDSGDAVLAAGAARLLDRVPGDVVVARAVAAYPRLSPGIQPLLLAALGKRRAPDALPLALKALGGESPALRQAAVSALGASGQGQALVPLAAFAARAEHDERGWALDALTALRGDGVDAALAAACGTGEPATRAMLLGVVAARRQPGATTVLLKAAADSDATVAVAALRGLGRIGGAAEVAPLTRLLATLADDAARTAAADAIVGIARRAKDRDAALRPVLEALPGAPTTARAAMLSVLAEAGGKVAVTALAKALDDAEATVREAALAGLTEVIEDPAAAPTLLALAKAAEGPRRVAATRGWLRLLALAAAEDAEKTVRALNDAGLLLARPEEQRQALGVLRRCRVPAAMALAASWMNRPELLAEAAATIRYLAAPQRADGRLLAAVAGPEATAAMDKVGALKDAHLPKPWRCDDLGDVNPAGSATFADGRWTLKAAGADLYNAQDGGMMVWQRRSGDVSVTAKVASLERTDPWAKAGVMVRASLEAGSPYVACLVSGNPQGVIQLRPSADAATAHDFIDATPPSWVRVQRVGNRFVCSVSSDGQSWKAVGERTLELPAECYVGLALSSHKNGTLTTAVVDGLEVSAP